MEDYYHASFSNKFCPKDYASFISWIRDFDLRCLKDRENSLISLHSYYNDMDDYSPDLFDMKPDSLRYDADGYEVDVDEDDVPGLGQLMHKHLSDGDVLTLIEVGVEIYSRRGDTADVVVHAIHSSGQTIRLTLDDITQIATDKLQLLVSETNKTALKNKNQPTLDRFFSD